MNYIRMLISDSKKSINFKRVSINSTIIASMLGTLYIRFPIFQYL